LESRWAGTGISRSRNVVPRASKTCRNDDHARGLVPRNGSHTGTPKSENPPDQVWGKLGE
jgi:hypothetical protein